MLFKKGEIVTDSQDMVFIDWAQFQTRAQTQSAHKKENKPLSLAFPNDEDIYLLKDVLSDIASIRLVFPSFRDGRAFSQARLLREHLGFSGELRATGEVLIDQVFFMARCGFDCFEIADDSDIKAWQKALTTFSSAYQPTQSPNEIWRLRHQK